MISKPMLAGTLTDISKVRLPVLATPKLDGIRCLVIDGKVLSRKFLDIPNKHIRSVMTSLPSGLDGELIIPNASFNDIQSKVMSFDGEPVFEFHVFDYVSNDIKQPYKDRINTLKGLQLPSYCIKVIPEQLSSIDEINEYEENAIARGYEGIMIRSIDSPYKCGRSTEREGFLLKVKRFADSEAVVIGFEEQLENTNDAEQDAFGRTKRSKAKDGMVGKETLGKFLVKEVGSTPWNGVEFAIGTGEGLTEELRQHIWDNRDSYLGQIVTYKYQDFGIKDRPRLPVWKGFRNENDL